MSLFFSSPWILPCHAVILQLNCSISDRLEMNVELCLTELILTLTVGCNFFLVCLYCQILAYALIVPWMRRFTSHNLRKSFTAIFTPMFRSVVLFSPHTCVYSGSSRWLSRRITYVITEAYGYTNDFKLQTSPQPPRVSQRLSIMPFQTLSTKQSEVAEFGITRLDTSIIHSNACL